MITILIIISITVSLTLQFALYVLKKDIRDFYHRIKHGDEAHQLWLKNEFQNHFNFVIRDEK